MDVNMYDSGADDSTKMVIDSQKAAPSQPSYSNDSGIPLPAQLPDGQPTTQIYDIESMRHVQLSDLCRTYKLPHSGTIPKLKECLRNFSRNPKVADIGKPYARNSHLGPKTGKASSHQKKSTQRREALFENVPPPSSTQGLPVVLSSAVALKQNERDLAWASSIIQRYPYRTKEARTRIAQERLAARRHLSGLDGNRDSATDQSIKKGLEDANVNITRLLDYVTGAPFVDRTTHASSISNSGASYHHQPATNNHQCMDPFPCTSISYQPIISSLPPSNESSAPPATRTITLYSGAALTFTEADVPPPPAISFAKNLPGLNRMWDDISEHWNHQSVLVIKGIPVPICYWKEVYTSKGSPKGHPWKQNQWKGLKARWFEWKVLVNEWRQGTPEEFWARFQAGGKRLGYKVILDRLAEQRMAENSRLCERAKVEYGDAFPSIFSYTKSGKTYVKSKASDVAKQYRELKGMVDEDEED
ncbi:unnamed protein product [Cyclocybe aegerita]|uniref:Uncharacterized protein n=1 Tax=Cyclocybe aegerita TaxID=1973307 RepID=A0A8S0W9H0_CYCAE|nr:unnamed protein product [Cyclocybe aegerita]